MDLEKLIELLEKSCGTPAHSGLEKIKPGGILIIDNVTGFYLQPLHHRIQEPARYGLVLA